MENNKTSSNKMPGNSNTGDKIKFENKTISHPKYTPEIITELPEKSIFVYGSNQYAQHGAGSAKIAKEKFGAINNDIPIGLCRSSYGIVTKSFSNLDVSLEFIKSQIEVLYYFALLRQDLTFYVTKIGSGLAGFTIEEIKTCFNLPFKPKNLILPKEFSK